MTVPRPTDSIRYVELWRRINRLPIDYQYSLTPLWRTAFGFHFLASTIETETTSEYGIDRYWTNNPTVNSIAAAASTEARAALAALLLAPGKDEP